MRAKVVAAGLILLILALTATTILLRQRSPGGGPAMLVDERMERLVQGKPQSLKVSVDAIGTDGWFLREYTCDGPDKTPTVTVTGIPGGAKAVALIMYDPDAPIGTFIHWLAVTSATGANATFPAPGMIEGRNDFRKIGYGGPCPPRGHGPHRYYFLVLALDEMPNLKPGFTLNNLLHACQGHVVAWGYTIGKYQR